jgi:hypothetical protein
MIDENPSIVIEEHEDAVHLDGILREIRDFLEERGADEEWLEVMDFFISENAGWMISDGEARVH